MKPEARQGIVVGLGLIVLAFFAFDGHRKRQEPAPASEERKASEERYRLSRSRLNVYYHLTNEWRTNNNERNK